MLTSDSADETIVKERFRKADAIIELYKERKYNQQGVADELKIPVKTVMKVTQLWNYSHTTEKTPENLKEGQSINPLIFAEQLAFLDDLDI